MRLSAFDRRLLVGEIAAAQRDDERERVVEQLGEPAVLGDARDRMVEGDVGRSEPREIAVARSGERRLGGLAVTPAWSTVARSAARREAKTSSDSRTSYASSSVFRDGRMTRSARRPAGR